MGFYPKKINERFQRPSFAREITSANAVGKSATFVCGAVLSLNLRIDTATKEIVEAGFQTSGCGFLIASADVLSERIVGRKLTEFHGLEKENLRVEIENVLGVAEADRSHCIELSIKTLQDAFVYFRTFTLEEFSGEKALICTCFGVSEEQIEMSIRDNYLKTVDEVGEFCNAGTGCGSCQPLIQEIIDTAQDVFN